MCSKSQDLTASIPPVEHQRSVNNTGFKFRDIWWTSRRTRQSYSLAKVEINVFLRSALYTSFQKSNFNGYAVIRAHYILCHNNISRCSGSGLRAGAVVSSVIGMRLWRHTSAYDIITIKERHGYKLIKNK